jgi:hypothetical protein
MKRYLIIGILIALCLSVTPVAAEGCDCCPPCCKCPQTLGYWKTHSSYGPAPYDDTWAGMEDAPFKNSGQTVYEVLWTEPRDGDAYYILAHQFIAAALNWYNGAAWNGVVDGAYQSAAAYFNGETNPDRETLIYWADILDNYNNGLYTPNCIPTD